MASTLDQVLQEIALRLETQCTSRVPRLRAQVAEELASFEALASRVDAELEELEARVSEAAAQFDSHEAEATGQIASRQETLESLVQHLVTEMDASDQALLHAEQAMSGAFDEFHSSLEAAQSAASAAAESLAANLRAWVDVARQGFSKSNGSQEALDRAAEDFTVACVRSAHDLASRCADVSRTLDQLNDRHVNDWMQAQMQLSTGTRQLLLGNVAQELQGEIRNVQDVLGALRGGAGGAASLLGGDAARLIGSFREVGNLLEQVQPLLRVIDELA